MYGRNEMNLRETCFLCGQPISGKADKEHILSDGFLAAMKLKEETLNISMRNKAQYSRLKVKAHPECNSTFGSRFEDYILKITTSFSENTSYLKQIHLAKQGDDLFHWKEVLSLWLVKLYLGFSWWECSLVNHPDKNYKTELEKALRSNLLPHFQKCFRDELWFNLPSSLFYYEVAECEDFAAFDFSSRHEVEGVFIKFRSHLLVLLIGDANLTHEYFNHHWERRQKILHDTVNSHPLNFLDAVAELWAVRKCLPLEPKLTITADNVVDESRLGYREKPEINGDHINEYREQFLKELEVRYKKDN